MSAIMQVVAGPYAGLPWPVQLLYVVTVLVILSSFLSVVVLALKGAQVRSAGFEEGAESQFLWVFLVPALNEEVTIADSVARLHSVQASNTLVLVIDDGSDDRTPQILDGLDLPELKVLRRDLPDARRGKAAALNAAWAELHHVLATPAYAPWTPEQVIVVVIDADGRLSPTAPAHLARHFADPRMAGVQSLVRIYNRRGLLTWAQDVEFGVFGHVFQTGRTAWGTANMGGNGQANRLAALDEVVEGDGPWRDRLTEDQDIGVRLLQAGWRGAQDTDAVVEQQGVPTLRRLYRQRTRWAQGGWESVTLLRGVGRARVSLAARLDMVHYLLGPVLQLVVGVSLVVAVVVAVVEDVSVWADTLTIAVLFVALSFGPGLLGLMLRGRGWRGALSALLLVVPYTLYSWIIFPVLLRALLRLVLGRSTWAKTTREPLEGGIHAEVEE